MVTLITSKRTSQKAARYRGTALVETAIAVILLLMFLLGIMAFGYLFWRAQQITYVTRHGARLACVEGADPGKVATIINAYLDAQGVTHDPPVIIIPTVVGDPVTVTVKGKNLDILNLRDAPLFGTGLFPDTFTASVTMAKEGPSE
jgi:Flp pilus assembly protein TadG